MTKGAMDGRSPRRITLTAADGTVLDGRLQGPDRAETAVVWCHPHPLNGGSMFAPLMNAVARDLSGLGWAVVRFDFRGVGESGGTHDGGVAEMLDVEAAVEYADRLAPTVILAGWSFGALVALRSLVSWRPTMRYVGVAPPIDEPAEFAGIDGSRLEFVVGTRDQVVDTDQIVRLAGSIGAGVVEVETDHFFMMRSAAVVQAIVGAAP